MTARQPRVGVALAAVVLLMLASTTCTTRDDRPPAQSGAGGRLHHVNVPPDWPGRAVYAVCFEDRTGAVGDRQLTDALTPLFQDALQTARVTLPLAVSIGCPFDYSAGPILTRMDPSVFVLQLYLEESAATAEPYTQIAEHWFRGRSDSAAPITLLVFIPPPLLRDLPALRAWLATIVGPDLTQLRR